MRDAIVPQNLDQIGRRIGLDRIHRLAGKLLDKKTRCACGSMRTGEDNRFIRRKSADYSLGIRILEQFKGPPKVSNQQEAALRWVSLGAAEARI